MRKFTNSSGRYSLPTRRGGLFTIFCSVSASGFSDNEDERSEEREKPKGAVRDNELRPARASASGRSERRAQRVTSEEEDE